MITRDRALLSGGAPGPALLRGVLEEFLRGAPRREKLRAYSVGAHEITLRSRRAGLPNSRLVNGFPAYITAMAAGYLTGAPISYHAPDQKDALESVLRAYRAFDAQSVDAELAAQASVYGRGCEVCYAAGETPRAAAVDPRCAFVCYDDTVEHEPLFGVTFQQKRGERGEARGFAVTVYTDRDILRYQTDTLSRMPAPESAEGHLFGGVPLTEYWNNESERGDFEGVLSLIDAYDILASDRVNDRQQFADALLVLTGVTGLSAPGDTGDTRTPGQRLREDKTLALPDPSAKVEWLTKAQSEQDADVLRRAIKDDIHKFSMVPDLTDEHFAQDSSGVAMRYKLLGLEQMTNIKERWFQEGLRRRLALCANYLRVTGCQTLDHARVQIVFKRNLPVNELELAQTARTLAGLVPDELLLSQLPCVPDAREAMKMRNLE